MTVPLGYTQLDFGFWSRNSDAASPFVFDGTGNMTLYMGTTGTEGPSTPVQPDVWDDSYTWHDSFTWSEE